MNQERLEMLDEYLKPGMPPVLLENIPARVFKNAIVIESNCDVSLLNGYYEEAEFKAPKWYEELIKLSESNHPILLINEINSIPPSEQNKFIEILKYRKVSTFDLPKNCTIVVTSFDLKNKPISEEIYSLVAQV